MHMPLVLTNRRRRGGAAASAFSPTSLFASSEQGVWYDPSDQTTLYQDNLGAAAVTAAGQTVGLILDKSQGLALGSELILNGAFATDLSNWPTNISATWDAGGALLSATSASAQLAQSFTTVVGRSYRLEYQFVSGNTGNSSVRVGVAANGTTIANVTMSAGAGTFSRIFVATATTTWVTLFVNYPSVSITGKWDNISVKEIAGNHAAQATVASRPIYQVDGGGRPYLSFETSDALATPSINFSSTDAMAVWAGVRKLSDASLGTVIEFSVDAINNAGAFSLRAPNTTSSAAYSYVSRGTALSLIASPTNYAAPITNVVTGISDISLDQSLIRVNGAQVGSNTADQGTGNYGTYPLYIGGRAGTSLFMNGYLYGLIVRGATSTTQQITDTETWIAAKTGVTL